MGLRMDGTVVAWGANYSGQTNVPTSLNNVVAIAAGGCHSLALIGTEGTLFRRANQGEKVTLSAGAPSGIVASYQWVCNGTNIVGATNRTLTIDGAAGANSGIYRLIVFNANGQESSQAISLFVPQSQLSFDISKLCAPSLAGAAQLRVLGASGQHPVVIYASSNLVNWDAVFTAPATVAPIDYSDTDATNTPVRFYRAEEAP